MTSRQKFWRSLAWRRWSAARERELPDGFSKGLQVSRGVWGAGHPVLRADMNRGVLIYRWSVFLLAAGYSVYQLLIIGDYSQAGGPFRYLTIWALLASFFCASRMIARTEKRTQRRWDGVVATTAVLNGMVVYLYWSLFFKDPALVNNGVPVWHQEYYLHALGPLLQWGDAIFIHRAFRKPLASVVTLLGTITAYVAWVEFFVAPLNSVPRGSVTSGYPYPFLNNLEFPGRAAFYLQSTAGAMLVLAFLFALGWAMRKWLKPADPFAAE